MSDPDRLRVIIDALASPRDAGGMRVHAEEVVRAWAERFPRDDLLLVGPGWLRTALPTPSPNVRMIIWPNESFLTRIVGEQVVVPILARLRPGHLLCSLSPVVSPAAPRDRSYAFSHDWRHLRRPHQFSPAQRLYRRTWRSSVRRARAVFAVSTKTAAEVRTVSPEATVVLALNGGDHPRRWRVDGVRRAHPPALVTFGHKNHKRPDLALRALALLRADGHDARLVVLGAVGGYRRLLRELATDLGVAELCRFPGFVDEDHYRRQIAGASAVLLLSDDDGFGLPVVEAQYFGAAAIVTADSRLAELHPGVVVADPTPQSIARAVLRALDPAGRPVLVGPPARTWAHTVEIVRSEMRAGG